LQFAGPGDGASTKKDDKTYVIENVVPKMSMIFVPHASKVQINISLVGGMVRPLSLVANI
jgi:hypothetical protein